MSERAAALSFSHVSMAYFTREAEVSAVQDLSFSVAAGEFLSIVGPSGCGKSTVLSLASALLLPIKGEVKLMGELLTAPDRRIGYMMQNDHLFPWRTILENVLLPLEIRHTATREAREFAVGLLEKYGLGEFIDRYPRELSGGMRQRAALIRTLVLKPEVLLLDEPFAALDAQTRLAVSDDLSRIMREEGKAVLLVTHDLSEAIAMGDRVLMLTARPGRCGGIYPIELSGSPLERRRDPRFPAYFDQLWKELDIHV